jgi:hypothetical protein
VPRDAGHRNGGQRGIGTPGLGGAERLEAAHRRRVGDERLVGQPAAQIAREGVQVLPAERPRLGLREVRGEDADREGDQRNRDEGRGERGRQPRSLMPATAPDEQGECEPEQHGQHSRGLGEGDPALDPQRPVHRAEVEVAPAESWEPGPADGGDGRKDDEVGTQVVTAGVR